MTISFTPGQVIQQGDLDIFFADSCGQPMNVAVISFDIYYVDPGPPEQEVLIGCADRTAVNPSVGSYYASIMVPPSAILGAYRIRWKFQEAIGSPQQEVVQEFTVVDPGAYIVSYSTEKQALINRLRVFLRDQNPDKFYRFMPPEHEGRIGKFNRVFGQVWEDAELAEYLEDALEWWNMMAPETEHLCSIELLVQQKYAWRSALIWGAMVRALMALSINWVHNEFDYSIGGISLSIEKSSKYESLKQNAESQFDKAVEMKARTTHYFRGLVQPRFGRGIRSAFGPYVGRGVLSPRSFL